MTRHAVVAILVLGLVALHTRAATAEDPAAILLSYSGTVTVLAPDGTRRAGEFGTHLQDGETVRTGARSVAEIMLSAGTWLEVGPDSEIQIGSPSGRSARPPSPAGEEGFRAVRRLLTLDDHRGTSRVGGLRSGAADPALHVLSPRNTAVRDLRPVFRWSAADSSVTLRLRLYDEQALRWEETVVNTSSLRYPEQTAPLEGGRRYSWTLESDDPLVVPPLRSRTAFFEVISEDHAEAVERELQAIESTDASPVGKALARAGILHAHGLDEEAIEILVAQARRDDQPHLRRLTAGLLIRTDRSERALEFFEDAVSAPTEDGSVHR